MIYEAVLNNPIFLEVCLKTKLKLMKLTSVARIGLDTEIKKFLIPKVGVIKTKYQF
jgi:hypothetical protein